MAALMVLTAGGLATATMGGAAKGATCDPAEDACVLVPPTDAQAYHAAFPDFGGPEDYVERDRLRHFEHVAGRDVAWAYFSNNWFDGEVEFPTDAVELIDSEGTVPFIRLMARSGFSEGRDPNFSMRSIAEGEWDKDLHRWCEDAAATGIPLLAEFGTEVNGFWFPWNGRWNGAGNRSWRDPDEPDGPERFRAAYTQIVEICEEEGADDITWFFHADVGGWPETAWNKPWRYYPGDDVVDWVGLSDYGPQKPGGPWEPFHERMDGIFDELLERLGDDKPLRGARVRRRRQRRRLPAGAQGALDRARGRPRRRRALAGDPGAVLLARALEELQRLGLRPARRLVPDRSQHLPRRARRRRVLLRRGVRRALATRDGSARAPSAMNGHPDSPGVGLEISHRVKAPASVPASVPANGASVESP